MNIYGISAKYEKLKNEAVRSSLIQISDDRRITVEECKEILMFDENTIKLRLPKAILTIVGLDLKMKNYSERGIIITGSVHSIGFDDSGRGK